MPKRIQRKRTKNWRMPEGVVYVGRPSKWGNPFHHCGDGYLMAPQIAVDCFRRMLEREGAFFPNDAPKMRTHKGVRQIEAKELTTVAEMRSELRGKDLACWCPLDQPCHADVLLEIANSDGRTPPREMR
jgi:hypothetical protein